MKSAVGLVATFGNWTNKEAELRMNVELWLGWGRLGWAAQHDRAASLGDLTFRRAAKSNPMYRAEAGSIGLLVVKEMNRRTDYKLVQRMT